jgi:Uma2 family endonuclease
MKTARLKEWTYGEFLSLPEGAPVRYEIIDGELCMTQSPASGNFLESFADHQRLPLSNPGIGKAFSAPCDVVFSKDPPQVVEPDMVFVSKEYLSIITEKNIQGVPDLTVEILSTATADFRVKYSLYDRKRFPGRDASRLPGKSQDLFKIFRHIDISCLTIFERFLPFRRIRFL